MQDVYGLCHNKSFCEKPGKESNLWDPFWDGYPPIYREENDHLEKHILHWVYLHSEKKKELITECIPDYYSARKSFNNEAVTSYINSDLKIVLPKQFVRYLI